jgi:hypothetical protein
MIYIQTGSELQLKPLNNVYVMMSMQVLCQRVMVQEAQKIYKKETTQTDVCLIALLSNLVEAQTAEI